MDRLDYIPPWYLYAQEDKINAHMALKAQQFDTKIEI